MISDILRGLLQAVDEQLCSPQTAYVKSAYDRLAQLGFSDALAREEIADCLGEELDAMLSQQRPFNEKNYQDLLDSLPWGEEPLSANDLESLS